MLNGIMRKYCMQRRYCNPVKSVQIENIYTNKTAAKNYINVI